MWLPLLLTACSNGDSDRIAELEARVADARISQLEQQLEELSGSGLDGDSVDTDTNVAETPSPDDQTDDAGEDKASDAESTSESIDYGQQYLAWIAPSNCVSQQTLEREVSILGSDGTFYEYEWPEVGPKLRAEYQKLADSLSSAINGAQTLTWPTDLQPYFDEVIIEMSQLLGLISGLASADTFTAYGIAIERMMNFEGRTQASLFRNKLGLPTNIGDQLDYCDLASGTSVSHSTSAVNPSSHPYFDSLALWTKNGAEQMMNESVEWSPAWSYARHLQQGFRAGAANEGGTTVSPTGFNSVDLCIGRNCFGIDDIVIENAKIYSFDVNGQSIDGVARAWNLGEMTYCLDFFDQSCGGRDWSSADLTSIYRFGSSTYVTFEMVAGTDFPQGIEFNYARLVDSNGEHFQKSEVVNVVKANSRSVWMAVFGEIDVSYIPQIELSVSLPGYRQVESFWFSPQKNSF